MPRQSSFVLRVAALIVFVLAVIAAGGHPLFDHDAVLLPLGLALWVGATLC